ncbi:hypothetical protein BH11PSE10_BH11PSE10_03750 [soil metagenome]
MATLGFPNSSAMNKNDRCRMSGMAHRFYAFPQSSALALGLLLSLPAALPQPGWAQAVDAASAPESAAASLVKPLPLPSARAAAPAPVTAVQPPAWLALSSTQKLALGPLERDWDGLDAERRSKWLSIATRFSALPAEEQMRMHERMRAWARSSPAERQQARVGFQVAKQIAADQRQAKWEAYQALPPEKRQELADKAALKRVAKPSVPRVASNNGPQTKSNLVPAALKGQPLKSVAPSVLQAKPGATTVLITQIKSLPLHQQAGQTKVFADPDLVNSKTLLPKHRLLAASQ